MNNVACHFSCISEVLVKVTGSHVTAKVVMRETIQDRPISTRVYVLTTNRYNFPR